MQAAQSPDYGWPRCADLGASAIVQMYTHEHGGSAMKSSPTLGSAAGTTPCQRHSRRTWMAYCPDCTAWHLTVARARRGPAAA